MALRSEEIGRKLLHLFALVMPAGILYLPKLSVSPLVPILTLASVLVGIIIFEVLRFKFPFVQKLFYVLFGSMLRPEEQKQTTGATFVIGAALLCSVLFYKYPNISFIVLTLFILGDAIAAIVGLSIGRIKIGKKSLEGSTACFLLCLLLIEFVFPHIPFVLEPWGGKMPLYIAVLTSLAITIFELIPLKITKKIVINDNLAVPVITGYVLIGLTKLV